MTNYRESQQDLESEREREGDALAARLAGTSEALLEAQRRIDGLLAAIGEARLYCRMGSPGRVEEILRQAETSI